MAKGQCRGILLGSRVSEKSLAVSLFRLLFIGRIFVFL